LPPRALSTGELNAIKRRLDRNTLYRKKYSDGPLVCLIDGVKRSALEPHRGASVDFEVKAGAHLLEIRSVVAEEEIPIVIYPIAYGRSGLSRQTSTAVLENGQRFSFNIEPHVSNFEEVVGATIRITHQPREQRDGLLSRLRTLGIALGELKKAKLVTNPNFIVPALAILVIAIFGGLWGYQRLRRAESPSSLVVQNQQAPPATELPSPAISKVQSESNNAVHRPEQAQTPSTPKESNERPLTFSDSPQTDEETRGRSQRPPSATLGSVKRVYVDSSGADSLSRDFRKLLIAGLKSSGSFVLVEGREDADAVFEASVHRLTPGGSLLIDVELVDASGQTIWVFRSKNHPEQFSRPYDASTAIVGALLKDLGAAARQP
jgi:hypothetical protein